MKMNGIKKAIKWWWDSPIEYSFLLGAVVLYFQGDYQKEAGIFAISAVVFFIIRKLENKGWL